MSGGGSTNPAFMRSLSEGVPNTIATHTTTGSNCSHTCSEEDFSHRAMKKVIFAAKQRRQIHGKRKDYTSITDELELMIASSPPLELPVDRPPSPQINLPAIQIGECWMYFKVPFKSCKCLKIITYVMYYIVVHQSHLELLLFK